MPSLQATSIDCAARDLPGSSITGPYTLTHRACENSFAVALLSPFALRSSILRQPAAFDPEPMPGALLQAPGENSQPPFNATTSLVYSSIRRAQASLVLRTGKCLENGSRTGARQHECALAEIQAGSDRSSKSEGRESKDCAVDFRPGINQEDDKDD